MKRFLSFLSVFVIVLTLASCSDKDYKLNKNGDIVSPEGTVYERYDDWWYVYEAEKGDYLGEVRAKDEHCYYDLYAVKDAPDFIKVVRTKPDNPDTTYEYIPFFHKRGVDVPSIENESTVETISFLFYGDKWTEEKGPKLTGEEAGKFYDTLKKYKTDYEDIKRQHICFMIVTYKGAETIQIRYPLTYNENYGLIFYSESFDDPFIVPVEEFEKIGFSKDLIDEAIG